MAPTKAFVVRAIHRAHSSGSEDTLTKTFATLDDASVWIHNYIIGLCMDYNWPEDWDSADMGGAPSPTSDLASVSRLQVLLAKSKGKEVLVWGPESEYECQRPEEILIVETS